MTKHVATLLFFLLATIAKAQDLHEPQLLVIDSAIDKITAFNDLLFPGYTLVDAEVKSKQLKYTFQINNHNVNCYYNLGRDVNISDPTIKAPRFITNIVVEGEGEQLLTIYNNYFDTKSDLVKEKEHVNSSVFTYHGVKYKCSFDPVAEKTDLWRLAILPD